MTKRKNNGLTLLSEICNHNVNHHHARPNLASLLCSSATGAEKDDSSSPSSGGSSSTSSPSRNYPHNIINSSNLLSNSPNNSVGSADSSPRRSSISAASPYVKSPWIHLRRPCPASGDETSESSRRRLVGSLVREEGHVYSLAATGDLLYMGSDSKNIRVWKNMKEYSGFKSSSGLVKAIVVWGDKIFTGHQDGKIRIWKFQGRKRKSYKRCGSLPTTKDYVKTAMNPKAYVEVRPRRNVPWLRHYDAVSCMSLDEEHGLLYSGSWDKTLKVWRLSDSKCVESVNAHDDAVNSVVVGFDGLVFTGSADGTVKAWRREWDSNGATRHTLEATLLKQDNAVTSLAASVTASVIYGGSSDGLVNFWERERNNVQIAPCNSINNNKDNVQIYPCSNDNRNNVQIGPCNNNKKCVIVYGGALRGHKLAVLCLAVAGNLVASGSADMSICVWRRDEGGVHTCLAVLTGHSGPVKCLAVEEDRYGSDESDECGDDDDEDEDDDRSSDVKRGDRQRWRIYSGSLDKSVKIWRLSEHSPDYI